MDMSGLSLDQAPPYNSVQRFFITAPIFSMLVSLVIAFNGEHIFFSFINIRLIGIIHWMTLGFITMSMMGAVMQMLPVLAGVKIKNPVFFSTVIHSSLSVGALLFGASYIFQMKQWLIFAGILITISMSLFSVQILYRLAILKNKSHTISAMQMSIASLTVVLCLGFYMLLWHLNVIKGAGIDIHSVHYFWAFTGWVGILIMGVSFQVIPMFYVSPEYPQLFRKNVPALIFILLILYAIMTFLPLFEINDLFLINENVYIRKAIRITIYFLFALFSIITIKQIQRRKRKLPDPALLFWYTSMIVLFLSTTLATTAEFYRGGYFIKIILLTGITFLFGFIFSVINGMLYKIVPFLSWFHLASKGIFDVPTMKDMLDDVRIKIQFIFHLLFLLSLPYYLFYPHAGHLVSGTLLFISSFLLWLNLYTVIRKYSRINNKYLLNKAKPAAT
ncbi:MAG: hypothetical protein OEV78_02765 [Spirochaetia bacterium]|nr:hypothetical protein [Spirochaetia bacterium]